MDVRISNEACQDLRRIDDPSVRAELLYIAHAELAMPEGGSIIEGRLRDYPGLWFRRGVRRASLADFEDWETEDDADDCRWQPFNFALVYRLATGDEKIDHNIFTSVDTTSGPGISLRRDTIVIVVKIWDNTVMANHYVHQTV